MCEGRFIGAYEESKKHLDVAICGRNYSTGSRGVKWILEIGFPEPYEELEQAARFWLNALPICQMVVPVQITEFPKYKCPLRFDLPDHEAVDIPRDLSLIHEDGFSLRGEFGPVMYRGYQWAGFFSEVFIETWHRNPITRQPERKEGSREYIIPFMPNIDVASGPQIRLADFLDLGPNDPQTTSLDWDEFRRDFKKAIKSLAVSRCRSWAEEHQRIRTKGVSRTGNDHDQVTRKSKDDHILAR